MKKTRNSLILFTISFVLDGLALAQDTNPFTSKLITSLDQPWAIEFLPDGRMLITEKPGRVLVVTQDGKKSTPISGVPEVDYGGQGGLGDVMLHPDFASNNIVYLSYAEAGDKDTRGATVGRGTLKLSANGGSITDFKVIWRQFPKVTGRGHFSHRMKFSPDGYLFITSGDRQKFDPAQDMKMNLGKVIRLNDDGSVPLDNPFFDQGGVTAQIWSLGHRNLLGIDFDSKGRLWEQEMGPRGGDELNLIVKGANYGYPIVSNGNHYNGKVIPDHDTRPEFNKPDTFWNPVISPAGLLVYNGDKFPEWKGNIFIGGLSSRSLVRVGSRRGALAEIERFNMGARIRDVEQGPNDYIWLLMDPDRAKDRWTGGLLKLAPNDSN